MNDTIAMQLKRIQGQTKGLVRMYEEERDCLEIVQQIVAVRNSLGTVARKMLSGEAVRCSREQRVEDLEKILKEILR